jgi:hypothetical protein
MEANAALRSIVRRDSGEGYREMLTRMAKESGLATPTADDLVRLDRARAGKKLSNADWESQADPDAMIAKLKDDRTRLAYKPEHALDLDAGVMPLPCSRTTPAEPSRPRLQQPCRHRPRSTQTEGPQRAMLILIAFSDSSPVNAVLVN